MYRVHYCVKVNESHGFEWFSNRRDAEKKLKEWWQEAYYDEEEEEYDEPWEYVLSEYLESFKVPAGKNNLLKFLNREASYADNGSEGGTLPGKVMSCITEENDVEKEEE